MKRLSVTCPNTKQAECIRVLKRTLSLQGLVSLTSTAAWSPIESSCVLECRVEDELVEGVLRELQTHAGIGIASGYCDVLDIVSGTSTGMGGAASSGDAAAGGKPKRIPKSVPITEVYDIAAQLGNFTTDTWVLLVVATVFAGAGLAEGSEISIVAAMLVSPLMGRCVARARRRSSHTR